MLSLMAYFNQHFICEIDPFRYLFIHFPCSVVFHCKTTAQLTHLPHRCYFIMYSSTLLVLAAAALAKLLSSTFELLPLGAIPNNTAMTIAVRISWDMCKVCCVYT